jgi:hypothetical protein
MPESFLGGIRLSRYSLDCWKSMVECKSSEVIGKNALRLLRWIIYRTTRDGDKKVQGRASNIEMMKIGPKAARLKEPRNAALAGLVRGGFIRQEGNEWFVNALFQPNAA